MALFLSDIFMEGLTSALSHFEMGSVKVRINKIEQEISALFEQLTSVKSEVGDVKRMVDKLKGANDNEVRDLVHSALHRVDRTGGDNADILCCFIRAIQSHITAITFKGIEKKKAEDADNYEDESDLDQRDELRDFVCKTMSVRQILENVVKLSEYESITGGRIATGFISTEDEMKECAHSIAVICKTFKIFDLECCAISAESEDSESPDNCIVLRFENRYDLSLYRSIAESSELSTEYVKSSRRNVYILGLNGAGKSTWGNLIAKKRSFEVGVSNHTTLIPLSYDVDHMQEFRIWDTPGLFDGSPEEGTIQDHMSFTINMNEYCSAVLFVFPRGRPPDRHTNAMLNYAIRVLGSFVKTQFIAILNDGESDAETRRRVYVRTMKRFGFSASSQNVFCSSALDATNADVEGIRKKLSGFKEELVQEHRSAYEDFIRTHSTDPESAIRNLFDKGKRELETILRRGNVTVKHFETLDCVKRERDVIIFEQNSMNYIRRKLKIGKNKVKETKTVKIRGNSAKNAENLITTVLARLATSYGFSEAKIFSQAFLAKDSYILLHTPTKSVNNYNYELWDFSTMNDEDIQSLVQRILGNLRH